MHLDFFSSASVDRSCCNYRTRAIISRGLYIFYPIFKDHFLVFKEVFSENSVLMYGLYSRAAYDGARTVCNELKKVSQTVQRVPALRLNHVTQNLL